VSRYHWLTGSVDSSYAAGGGAFPSLSVNIPAGATMKRFLTNGIQITGVSTGAAFDFVVPMFYGVQVDITAGAYSPRNIYKTTRMLPFQAVTLYDSTTAQRIYSNYVSGGDLECAINVKCSYGLASGPGFTVTLSSGIGHAIGALGVVTGRMAYAFHVLYFL